MTKTKDNDPKKKFLRICAMDDAIRSSLNTRNKLFPVYRKEATESQKENFRKDLRMCLCKIAEKYESTAPERHCKNIKLLSRFISKKHGDKLHDGRFRIGVAQKALNLYLKHLWCIGYIQNPPPHCPVDGIILRQVPEPIRNELKSWTECTKISEYEKWICELRKVAKGKGLAEWELEVWNDSAKK